MQASDVIDSFAEGLERAITAASNARSNKNHARAPAEYNGSRADYETFRRGLELFVKAIPKDREKIIAAVSLLTSGDADAWAQNFMQDYGPAVDADAVPWTSFLGLLDKKFLDPRTAEYAREQLFRMNQGRQDADSFFLRFDELRVKGGLTSPEYHDKILVEHLKKHLNPQLVIAIQTAHEAQSRAVRAVFDVLLPSLPDTMQDQAKEARDATLSYAQFRELALEHDPAVRRFGFAAAHSGPRNPPAEDRRPRAQTYAPPVAPANPTIQVAPATAVVAPALPRGDPMDLDRARARNSGLCYRCRKPGHIARDCKERDMREVVRSLSDEEFADLVRARMASAVAENENTSANPEDFANPQ